MQALQKLTSLCLESPGLVGILLPQHWRLWINQAATVSIKAVRWDKRRLSGRR